MKKMRTTRRSVFYAAIASLPLLLAACAEQAETPGAGSAATPITVTIATDGTRAAIDLQSVQIAEGQQLLAWFPAGVTLADGTASPCTTTYTVGAANAVTPTQQPYLQAGERSAAVHLLYAPDTGTGTDSWPNGAYPTAGGTFTVKQDQSDDDNYRLSDLMYGTATAVRTDDTAAAAVTMRHLMSKLVVTATAGAGISQVKAIYIVTGYRGMSVAVSNGAVTLEAADASAIDATAANRLTMLSGGTSTTATAAALLPPQTIDAGALIAVETDMGTVNYALPAARQLMPGEVSTFDVTPSRSDLGQTVTLPDAHEPAGSDTHRNRLAFHLPDGTTFNMVFVEGGRMENLYTGTRGEATGYNVTLSDYYIAETEVTQQLWKAVMGGMVQLHGGSALATQKETGDMYPVNSVSWNMINTATTGFIDRLNAATIGSRPSGWEFSLPTSAQWEYAARGGQHSAGFTYAGGDNLAEIAVLQNVNTIKPVASLKPNELGLYDMAGNVWEWCLDYKEADGGGSPVSTDVAAAGEYTDPWLCTSNATNSRVVRGGGYSDATDDANGGFTYQRTATDGSPDRVSDYFGFRVALVKQKVPPLLGDLYFSDGTWGTAGDNPGKTPIGIVFRVGTSTKDRALGYTRGYVMALGDASDGTAWGTTTTAMTDTQIAFTADWAGANNVVTDMDGLTHCRTAKCYRDDATNAATATAMNLARTYTPAAPSNSSGWYLPSIGQMYMWWESFSTTASKYSTYMPVNESRYGSWSKGNEAHYIVCGATYAWEFVTAMNNYVTTRLGGRNLSLFTPFDGSYWWSSTERNGPCAWFMNLQGSGGDRLHLWADDLKTKTGTTIYKVRPVLAF